MSIVDMDPVQKLFDATPEPVLRLARVVSLAARVEPELLRHARLELFPELNVGAEADLWFSSLIASRSTRWMVFRTDVSRRLRAELAAEPELLRKAWALLQVVHAGAAPAILIEEEVTHLALDGAADTKKAGDAGKAIEKILGGVLHAVTAGHRVGLLDWATRAIPALPALAQQTESAAALAALVSSRSIGPGAIPRLLNNRGMAAAVAKRLPTTDLWLRLVEGGSQMRLDLSRKELTGAKSIQVPITDPVVVEMRIEDDRKPFVVKLPEDSVRSVLFDMTADAQLQTLTGTVYRVAREWLWKEHKAVLIAGPARKLSPWLRKISFATGAMLAEEGCLLITAGGSGVEQLAAEGFASVAAKSAGVRMRHYIGRRRRAAVTLGKVVQTSNDRSWARNAVRRANAVIVFEGGPRTELLGRKAIETGTRLIPVGDSGAASRLRSTEAEYWWGFDRYGALTQSAGNIEKQVEQIRTVIKKLEDIAVRAHYAPDGEPYAY